MNILALANWPVETQRHEDAEIEEHPHVSRSDFFSIALQLIDTLHLLHLQHIIHKDLKPANILFHPETQQVKLIDFSIASLLPRETQEIQNPNVLEGTLAYLSPEQTGRMNRGIDYRSDFYSLGVTFFESCLCNREGHHYPVELTINHITFQEKEYHLAFMVDISDRKRAESAILQKSQELEQALQDLLYAQLQFVQSE